MEFRNFYFDGLPLYQITFYLTNILTGALMSYIAKIVILCPDTL